MPLLLLLPLLLQVVGEAVFHAARLAIMDKAPALLPGVTVNLTCINSKCVDIPTYNAVYDLAEEGAGAWECWDRRAQDGQDCISLHVLVKISSV
jgi:hypothetical protein